MMFTMSATAFVASPDDASQEVQVQESATARASNYFSGGTGMLNTMAGKPSKLDPVSSGSVPDKASVTDVELHVTVSSGVLRHATTNKNGKRTYRSTPANCKDCPFKSKCGANEKGQKYAAMNLKKLAIWSWNNSIFSEFIAIIFPYNVRTPAFVSQKQVFFDSLRWGAISSPFFYFLFFTASTNIMIVRIVYTRYIPYKIFIFMENDA